MSLAQCVNMERLHLGSNKIENLPAELFSSLTKLKELFIHKNKLTAIPPEVKNLQGKTLTFLCIHSAF